MVSAKTNLTSFNKCLGSSSKSFLFRLGIMILVTVARLAASIFSLSPPIGRTRPRKVTSPVMATSWRAGMLAKLDIMAVAMVMPAEGPSLGMAPAGT